MDLKNLLLAVQLLSLLGYCAIAALAARAWLRLRNPSQMYLALAIGSLALVSLVGRVGSILPKSVRVDDELAVVAFLGSGLALLLFRDTVLPLPRLVRRAAIGITGLVALLMVGDTALGNAASQPRAVQLTILILLVGTWIVSVGEPSARMWIVARRLPRVQRSRLRALGGGYLGIIAVLLLAVAGSLFSGSKGTSTEVSLAYAVAGLLLLPLLYAGFAPPTWLRRLWRQGEETDFQAAIHDLLMYSPDRETFARRALDWALRLAGAHGGYLAYPTGTVLAASGLSSDQAGQRLVSPIVIGETAGELVLMAGPFTPVFAADEVAWLKQYATLVAPGLERVRLVEQMSDLNAQLKEKVDEVNQRTAELQAANKELEAFSYTVSHDLRAPLRAINGFSAILLEEHADQLSPEGRQFLQRIADGGQRMGALVDDLLAFSRLSRQALRTQEIQPKQVVQRAWEQLASSLEGRQVELEIRDLPVCRADPLLLEQVFVNLLGNAIKYSSKREVAHIRVGALPERENGQVVFFVKDDGVGFDMQYVGKLFGVFQRLHKASDYEGTGVGLAIVQRIVHRHGGRIWAEAQPDHGATFYFTLEGGTSEWQQAA